MAATTDGEALRLRPASRVPADLRAALLAHKIEVLALLTATGNDPAAPRRRPPGANCLVPHMVDEAVADPLPYPEQRAWPSCASDAELVTAMAEALASNSVYTITNRETAVLYFRGRALAMLAATPDKNARGLSLGYERHRHALMGNCNAARAMRVPPLPVTKKTMSDA